MEQKRGRQILKIEKKLKQSVRAALIPYGRRLYAGHARYAALRYFKKNTKQIIYLSALHNINKTNTTYILHRDKGFRLGKHNFIHTSKRERSFDWVHDELKDIFPSAKILALGPNGGVRGLHTWIINYLRKHKNAIFLATIDPVHYGNSLSYPQQMDKIKKEEKLITAILSPNTFNRNIVDAQKTLEIFMKVMGNMKLKGRVTDYYDSHGSRKNNLIDRYSIDVNPVKQLVSYVSIIYGKKLPNELFPIDILLAIGLLKSIIVKNTYHKTYNIRLPYWSPLYRRKSGVFVGTSLGNNINCSYGQYEGSKSTAIKIAQAANKCNNDASKHWQTPYTPENIHHLSYKVEFLEPKSKWKTYPGSLAPKRFSPDGTSGIFLRLPNGKSATYLPGVFRNNPQWSITDIMNKLTEKADAHQSNDWKKGNVQEYKTTSYTWNPYLKMIDVFPPPPFVKTTRKNKTRKNKTRKKKLNRSRKHRI